MEKPIQISCELTSDLMVVYATDKASAETRQLVDAHLQSCPACAYAFRNEPSVRAGLKLPPVRPERNFTNSLARAGFYLQQGWGGVLFGLSRFLDLLGWLLRRVGISTASLKIRTFRLRRKLAGTILGQMPAASR